MSDSKIKKLNKSKAELMIEVVQRSKTVFPDDEATLVYVLGFFSTWDLNEISNDLMHRIHRRDS